MYFTKNYLPTGFEMRAATAAPQVSTTIAGTVFELTITPTGLSIRKAQ